MNIFMVALDHYAIIEFKNYEEQRFSQKFLYYQVLICIIIYAILINIYSILQHIDINDISLKFLIFFKNHKFYSAKNNKEVRF